MTRRALIVDDEPLIAMDLAAMLGRLGVEPFALATNPREAVERAASLQPDLVLMDVYLDGSQGIKAAKWLHHACEIPVLFVTGHDDSDTIAQIHEQLPGVSLCIKPVSENRLALAIASATGWTLRELR
jgi:CheY-like chemotaxis protein